MQRPLLHLNWVLEQEWLQPASSLLSPQSLSGGRQEGKRRAGGQQVAFSMTPAWGPRSRLPVPTLEPPHPSH